MNLTEMRSTSFMPELATDRSPINATELRRNRQPRGKYEVSRSPERERMLETLRQRRDQRRTVRGRATRKVAFAGLSQEMPSVIAKHHALKLPELDETVRRPKFCVEKMSTSVKS